MPFLALAPRLTLHYLDYNPTGSPTALLLHGLGANGESWILQVPEFINWNFRVLAPDTRGFGKSSYPGGSVRIADLSGDVVALLHHLKVETTYTIGISMGGTLALQIALEYPQLVKKLVLVNTFASLRPDRLSVWFYFALRFIMVHTVGLPAQAKAVSERIFPAPDQTPLRMVLQQQICQASPEGYRAAMRALGLFNISSRLGEIHCPTLVVTGENDSTVPPKNQAVLVKHISSARQIVIPGAGHAVSVEKPELFNRILIDFLMN